MSNKMAILVFTVSVLLASVAVTSAPQASALIQGTMKWNLSSASLGNSKVCGDHVCAPGEQTHWLNAMAAAQRLSYGKIADAPHGEDVIDNLVNSTSSSTTMHGNAKMIGNMNMTGSTGMPSNGMK